MDPAFQQLLNALAAADADYTTKSVAVQTAASAYEQACINWGNNPSAANATLAQLAWNNVQSTLDAAAASLTSLQAARQAVNDYIGIPQGGNQVVAEAKGRVRAKRGARG